MSKYLASDYVYREKKLSTVFSEGLFSRIMVKEWILRKGFYLNLNFFLYDKGITDTLLISTLEIICFLETVKTLLMKGSN